MSYLNQVIRRQAPLTRCQCAVLSSLAQQGLVEKRREGKYPYYRTAKP